MLMLSMQVDEGRTEFSHDARCGRRPPNPRAIATPRCRHFAPQDEKAVIQTETELLDPVAEPRETLDVERRLD